MRQPQAQACRGCSWSSQHGNSRLVLLSGENKKTQEQDPTPNLSTMHSVCIPHTHNTHCTQLQQHKAASTLIWQELCRGHTHTKHTYACACMLGDRPHENTAVCQPTLNVVSRSYTATTLPQSILSTTTLTNTQHSLLPFCTITVRVPVRSPSF